MGTYGVYREGTDEWIVQSVVNSVNAEFYCLIDVVGCTTRTLFLPGVE